jgi:hypothetical protein
MKKRRRVRGPRRREVKASVGGTRTQHPADACPCFREREDGGPPHTFVFPTAPPFRAFPGASALGKGGYRGREACVAGP